jgi:hypothetical protein
MHGNLVLTWQLSTVANPFLCHKLATYVPFGLRAQKYDLAHYTPVRRTTHPSGTAMKAPTLIHMLLCRLLLLLCYMVHTQGL